MNCIENSWYNDCHNRYPKRKRHIPVHGRKRGIADKYKGYHISHLDTKLYDKKTNQNNLLGDMVEAMSLAKITKGR